MKKMKLTQKVALILLLTTLFSLLAGCTTPADPTDPTETDPILFGGATDFTANLYAKYRSVSFAYKLDVSVSGGKVYINDVLYDKVSYVDNPGVDYFPLNQYRFTEDDGLSSSVLEQINACKKCYLLEVPETEENTTYGKTIAVYEINVTYYFVRTDSPEVVYIHDFKPEIGG